MDNANGIYTASTPTVPPTPPTGSPVPVQSASPKPKRLWKRLLVWGGVAVGVFAVAGGAFGAYSTFVYKDVELAASEQCELNAYTNYLLYRAASDDFSGEWNASDRIAIALYADTYNYEQGCGDTFPSEEEKNEITAQKSRINEENFPETVTTSQVRVDELSRRLFDVGVSDAEAQEYSGLFDNVYDVTYANGDFVGTKKTDDEHYLVGHPVAFVQSVQKNLLGNYKVTFDYYQIPSPYDLDINYFLFPTLTPDDLLKSSFVRPAGSGNLEFSYTNDKESTEKSYKVRAIETTPNAESEAVEQIPVDSVDQEGMKKWFRTTLATHRVSNWMPYWDSSKANFEMIVTSTIKKTDLTKLKQMVSFDEINSYTQELFGVTLTDEEIEKAVEWSRKYSLNVDSEASVVNSDSRSVYFAPAIGMHANNMNITRIDKLDNGHVRVFVEYFIHAYIDNNGDKKYDDFYGDEEVISAYMYDFAYTGDDPTDYNQWVVNGVGVCPIENTQCGL